MPPIPDPTIQLEYTIESYHLSSCSLSSMHISDYGGFGGTDGSTVVLYCMLLNFVFRASILDTPQTPDSPLSRLLSIDAVTCMYSTYECS